MHYISRITIKNYKSIVNAEFLLSSYTALVGYNNAGKSNILEAIKWLISKSSLPQGCFNNTEHAIEITGDIEGINEEILDQLPDKHRNSIKPYINEQRLEIRRKQTEPSQSVKNINIQVWNEADQNWANPAGIENAIKQLFSEPIEIGAMEDSAEDVAKFKASTTIGKLITEVMAPIEENHSAAIADALEQLKQKFDADSENRAQELIQFDEDTTAKLRRELFLSLIHI